MSTDLYGVRILDVDPSNRLVKIRVFVVYYETTAHYHQPIPDDASFFTRLLCDVDALKDDIDGEKRFDESYIDQNAFRYIDRVTELSRSNYPLAEDDYKNYSDFYYERDGKWQDEEKLVQADFEFVVTKGEYLAPLSVGDSWGTTSYPTQADRLTAAQYPILPEFGEWEKFSPFPGAEREASATEDVEFNADGSRLLIANQDGGVRVFSTIGFELLHDYPDAGEMFWQATWDHEGNVLLADGGSELKLDLESGEKTGHEPRLNGNHRGSRFTVNKYNDQIHIVDQNGNTLMRQEHDAGEDMSVIVSFAADEDTFAVGVEGEGIMVGSLSEGVLRKLALSEYAFDISLSPDGQFIACATGDELVVVDLNGVVLRRMENRSGLVTNVDWHPSGDFLAASWAGHNGYNSQIFVYPVGRIVDQRANAPVAKPEQNNELGFADFVRQYAKRTSDFSSGWSDFTDSDLVDCHGAAATLGLELDVTGEIVSDHLVVVARAYESIFARQNGDHTRADNALKLAKEQLDKIEVPEWDIAATYGPLAAACALAGDKTLANSHFEFARSHLDNEANEFQKRLAICRSYLFAECYDSVAKVADYEPSWFSDSFHLPLIAELAKAGRFELFRKVFDAWNLAGRFEHTNAALSALSNAAQYDAFLDLAWLNADIGYHETTLLQFWIDWFERDRPGATARFDIEKDQMNASVRAFVRAYLDPANADHVAMSSNDKYHPVVLALSLRSDHPEAAETFENSSDWQRPRVLRKLAELGGRIPDEVEGSDDFNVMLTGQWEAFYEKLTATKKTKRGELLDIAYRIALGRGDYDIVYDLLGRMHCVDMNSDGVRAMQETLVTIAGPAYRKLNP